MLKLLSLHFAGELLTRTLDFLSRLGVKHPIIQAPMAGGGSTPQLIAAVCNAGALGSIGAAYLGADDTLEEIKRVRRLTSMPFNVNLFAGGYDTKPNGDAQQMLEVLAAIHEKLQLPAPVLPPSPRDPFKDQLEAILDARPAIFSFTFGIPSHSAIERIKARGISIIGTATTLDEAVALEGCGADAIVAQGAEAGAHRGTFLAPFESSMVPTTVLVDQTCQRVKVPVIASGGLMDGRDIARSLARGAWGVQLGTAFLPCTESGISDSYKRAILTAKSDQTVVTKAFSGRPARGLVNTFIEQMMDREKIILPFPLQNVLTRPMRNAAARLGLEGFQSLWAGQGVARARALPAARLVDQLMEEFQASRGGAT